MRKFKVWYEAGYQEWEFAGAYNAASEADAIAMAKADGASWATVIASDTNPNQAHRRKVVKNAQTARRDRLTQAANRLGADTIDKLAAAVLALSEKDAEKLRQCFAELTRNRKATASFSQN